MCKKRQMQVKPSRVVAPLVDVGRCLVGQGLSIPLQDDVKRGLSYGSLELHNAEPRHAAVRTRGLVCLSKSVKVEIAV